jgi:hypothetical protein
MSDNRHVTVLPDAIVKAKRLGISGNIEERLKRMALRAAIITHPQGNRRFGDYLLRIKEGRLEMIMRYDPETKRVCG